MPSITGTNAFEVQIIIKTTSIIGGNEIIRALIGLYTYPISSYFVINNASTITSTKQILKLNSVLVIDTVKFLKNKSSVNKLNNDLNTVEIYGSIISFWIFNEIICHTPNNRIIPKIL